MTKELALRPQYAQYPNPNPKPELFGQTRPDPDPIKTKKGNSAKEAQNMAELKTKR